MTAHYHANDPMTAHHANQAADDLKDYGAETKY
jgi:hypothetical protein